MRLRAFLLASALLLPMLSLVPLGSFWLWERGLLLYWVAGAFVFTMLIYGLEAWALPARMFKRADQPARFAPSAELSAREAAARIAVETLADNVDPATVQSRNDLAQLAVTTIEAVANQMHPDDKTPVWNFTIPEVLLLTERVSARLRPIFVDGVPLGDTLTVGQVIRLYEWRSVVGVAEKVYDIWRLLRILNPVAAVTQEARERVTKQIVASVRDDFTKRIARIYVMEVGLGAIDLYSGRLRDLGPSRMADPLGNATSVEASDGGGATTQSSRLAVGWLEAKKLARAAAHLYGRNPKQ